MTFPRSEALYARGFALCDYSRCNKAAWWGSTRSRLSLISGSGWDAPEVVSGYKRCAFQIILYSWAVGVRGHDMSVACEIIAIRLEVCSGKMNRIDQNGVLGKLEFPEPLEARVPNAHASLITSVWLMGKIGLDFSLCLLFLEGI